MTAQAQPEWVVLGRGRMGQLLCAIADRLGVTVRATWSRADGPVLHACHHMADAAVFVAVADDAIAEVAESVSRASPSAFCFVHCSGRLSSSILREAGLVGPVASVHPLLSIADPERALDGVAEAAWTVEGDATACEWATRWLGQLDVQPTVVDGGKKTMYHAAAVTSAGLVVGLIDVAFELAATAGISTTDARAMLLPLARSAIDNLEQLPAAQALTGPVARGDEATLQAHRLSIASDASPSATAVYEALTARCREIMQDRAD